MDSRVSQDTFQLLATLVGFDSTSCLSNRPISEAVAMRLEELGFSVSLSSYHDAKGVEKVNVVGKLEPTERSSAGSGLAYFCHSDVVPSEDWTREHGPFELTLEAGRLYGRGACDMKGSAACMLEAVSRVARSSRSAPFYFVCTADEEVGFGGARHFATSDNIYRELVDQQTPAIIGEPTSLQVVHAHKGICGLRIVSRGRSAHSSSREGINANLAMIPFLSKMLELREKTLSEPRWLHADFDPADVSWNIGINDFNYAPNITASRSVCTIFFRPMPGVDAAELIDEVQQASDAAGLECEIEMNSPAVCTDPHRPFVSTSLELAGRDTAHTVANGTDGGEFSSLCDRVVFGPGDIAQAHTSDEWISVAQIAQGIDAYERFVRHYCT